MSERAISEATAFALDRRNFDYLPDDLAVAWRASFLVARERTPPGPRKLIVEILNSCNLDCPMCRVGQHGIDLQRRMSLADFANLIAELNTATTVRLNGLGESTLLPDFGDYVAALRARELSIELITNGSGAIEDYAAVALAGGHILVSWDAAEPRIFEQLRRPARWDAYRGRLSEIAFKTASTPGRCSIIFTLQKANIGEFEGVVRLAGDLGLSSVQMNVAKSPTDHWLTANMAAVEADVEAARQSADRNGVAVFIPAELGGTVIKGGETVAGSGCSAPWQEVVVRWNGDVQVCNMFNPYTYGNIHRRPFPEIWRSAFAEVFRSKVNSHERHPYCVGCVYMPGAYDL
jgi:radical SAM protein with 4Fe4S-binding SPASM domain